MNPVVVFLRHFVVLRWCARRLDGVDLLVASPPPPRAVLYINGEAVANGVLASQIVSSTAKSSLESIASLPGSASLLNSAPLYFGYGITKETPAPVVISDFRVYPTRALAVCRI